MSDVRKILVTSALPYANGAIHLGHLLEYIQTDIWVRFQKLNANQCHYVCADDAHGTAIMLRAKKLGIEPDALIAAVKKEHEADFSDFLINFDHFHSTHSPENHALATQIYQRHRDKGFIVEREITQLYDEEAGLFLADRFVKGECPKCGAADQYGDNCEHCSSTYAATELVNPISTYTGSTPTQKPSTQLFFDLPQFEGMLKEWLQSGRLQSQVSNKLLEWFEDGLQQWDISREAPYFGFEIPDYPGKYFYVWLDAPIGYMASFQHLCDNSEDLTFGDYWSADSTAELYHFIGKDIINFHGLFWPAMLDGAGYRQPTAIFAHGFLTVNGQKMSKSRGTFIKARTYLKHLQPEYLRYYFASKLTSKVDDLDLNLDDFVAKVNSDLINKWVNLASRCAKFINKQFDNQLSDSFDRAELVNQTAAAAPDIAAAYEAREFSKAVRDTMGLVDLANQYIDEVEPWVKIKQAESDEAKQEVQQICTTGLELFRLASLYLKPILPNVVAQVENFLNLSSLTWKDAEQNILGQKITKFKPLMKRIDAAVIEAMLESSKEDLKAEQG